MEDTKFFQSNVFDSNKGITDAMLQESFPTQLKSGQVFLYYAKPTSNSEYVDMYFAQARPINRGKNLNPSASTGEVLGLSREGKWGGGAQIIRFRDTLNIENVQDWNSEGPVVVGSVLDEDIAIKMYQNHEPATAPGYTQPVSQVTRGEDVLAKVSNGKGIYEHTYLDRVVEGEVLDSPINFELVPIETLEPVVSATPATV